MSKFTTFLSGNVALVGGGAAATAVAVIALLASGVLNGPEPAPAQPEETAQTAPVVAEETAAEEVADPAPEETAEEAAPEESAAAETETVAEAAPEAEVTPEAETPAPVLPVFDLVRIDAEGEGQIAGTAAANALVAVLLDGAEIASVAADGSGKFFTFITLGPNPQPRELLLVERRDDGDLISESAFLVAPIAAPVVVAEAETATEDPAQEPEPEASETVATVAEATPETLAESASEAVVADVEEVAEQVVEAAEEAVEELATETTAAAQPQAPAVLVSDADGVRVVQPAANEDAPEVTSAVSIDAISYADTGAVVVAGRGLAGQFVRLYLDNALAATQPVDDAGQWRVELADIDAGLYTMRADEVDADGKVRSRVETPFKRETPARVAEAQALTEAASNATEEANETVVAAAEDVVEAEPETPVEEVVAAADTVVKELPAEDAEAPEVDTEVAQATITEAKEDPAPVTAIETASEQVTPAANTAPVEAPEVAEPETADPVVSPQPAVQIVTVQPGSSLWAIARDRYGEGTMYVRVFEANKDKIRDPDLIYPGQVFTVPE